MANKLSVELDANVKGFVDGMNQASESAKQYETDQRKVADSAINFKKELGSLRREVMNLAGGYARLDDATKNSDFGKQMKKQLDTAKASLADMVDLQGDLNQEIKNMASDTRGFDTMIEGLGIIGDSASAAFGAIATFTGNTEDAKKAVTVFTTVTSALSAATKIQNALQAQSNTMMAVAKIQTMAATAAEKARTSAVIGSTVAQKAFNAVAKANPYVLLATAVIAATGAIWAYVEATKESESVTDRLKREMHEASIQGQKDAQGELTKLDLLYKATQDVNLSMEDRLTAVKNLRAEYPGYFKDLKDEEILAGKAESAYKKLTSAIIASAQARAYEKKIQDLSEQNIDLDEEIKKQKEVVEQMRRRREAANNMQGSSTTGTNAAPIVGESSYQSAKDRLKELEDQQNANTESINEYSKSVLGLNKELNELNKNKEKDKEPKGGGGNSKKEITETQTLQSQMQKLEDEYVKLGDVATASAEKRRSEIRKEIQDINDQLNHIKLLKEQSQGKLLGGKVDTKNIVADGSMVSYDANKMVKEAQQGLGTIKLPVDSHPLVELQNQLKKLREELELAPDTTAYQETLQKIADKEKEISDFKGDKNANKTADAWKDAASAMSNVGNAMRNIEDPSAQIAGIVMQAIANIVAGFASSTAKDGATGNVWYWIAAIAAGMATMISTISAIHSQTGYAEGGIVGGSSYAGDRIPAMLNSGEMVLNKRQQKNLFDMLDMSAMPQSGGSKVVVEGVISGTDLLLVQKNTNKVRRRTGTQITF